MSKYLKPKSCGTSAVFTGDVIGDRTFAYGMTILDCHGISKACDEFWKERGFHPDGLTPIIEGATPLRFGNR